MSRRGQRDQDSHRYYDWIKAGSADLAIAELLLRADSCYEGIAFHCQQCIEKSLKAYIIYQTGRHVDGHNLTWLCKQALKYNQGFAEYLDESIALNRYYIETRYPTDIPLFLTKQTVSRAFSMAQDLYEYICHLIYGDNIDDD